MATMGDGSHAEVVSVPARSAWKVPAGLSIEEAAGKIRVASIPRKVPVGSSGYLRIASRSDVHASSCLPRRIKADDVFASTSSGRTTTRASSAGSTGVGVTSASRTPAAGAGIS